MSHDLAAGSSAVAGPITNATAVSNGLFTVTLDFGPGLFTGEARWLEIGVREGGSTGLFEVLGTRQALTPAPYALHAYSVTASNVNGVWPASRHTVKSWLPYLLVGADGFIYAVR